MLSMAGRKARITGAQGLLIAVSCLGLLVATEAKCFHCLDKTRCRDAKTIYDQNNTLVFTRHHKEKFQLCSNVTAPRTSAKCDFCLNQTELLIVCSSDVQRIEVEDHTYLEKVIEISCDFLQTLPTRPAPLNITQHVRNRCGLYVAPSLFAIVLLILGISFIKTQLIEE